jgi:CO dehydrogenase/acetyl-CoA synthase epsilon subunit
MKDAISVPNAAMFLPKVVSNIVKEAAEPLLVGTSLLQRIEYHAGQTITFPAVGALVAADIAEGQEYPERQLQMGGATVTATIGKSGVAVKVTDEMIKYSQYDVIGMHLRAAGRALARHKEQKIFNYINSMGVVCFDNATPTNSLFGVTHGRGLDGAANGSVIMDDIFDAFGQIIAQGWMPDTLLMHPLTWIMWIKDPVLRAFALAAGGGTFFASWKGNPQGRAPWDNSAQGGLGVAPGQNIDPSSDPLTAYAQNINSAPVLPSYFPIPFRIVVSPFVPYNPVAKTTDIMIFDSANLGVLIVDEDAMTEEFDDPARDIRKIKIRERYAIAILNEGQAIGTLKNVSVKPNHVVLPARATLDIAGSIAEIPPTTPIS